MPFHDYSVLASDVTSTDSDASFEQSSLMPVAHGLRIALLNCRSLLPHKEEIFNLLCNFHLDVLTLSEIWLDDTIPDSEILPGGCDYSLIRRDRNCHGGGIAILISYHCQKLDLSRGEIESLWVELYLRNKVSLLLCCAYRPPSKLDFISTSLWSVKSDFHMPQKF